MRSLVAAISVGVSALSLPVAVSEPERSVYVVWFAERITDVSRSAVEDSGAEVIAYEPHDGYFVWAETASVHALEQLPAVRSVRPLTMQRKLSPALPDSGVTATEVAVYAPALPQARAALTALGEVRGPGLAGSDGLVATLTVILPIRALAAAAEVAGVLYIAPAPGRITPLDEMGAQVVAGNIEPSSNRPITGYAAWLAGQGLDGDGVKVAIVDTGIQDRHPDLDGRVERPVDYAFVGEEPGDPRGHGTTVASVVGGAPPLTLDDLGGFAYGLGMAPAVRMVDLNHLGLLAPSAGQNLPTIARDAWRAGARISNNSWLTGEQFRPGYTATSRMVDVLTRNADLETPGAQEHVFVFAAGNDGDDGPHSLAEAKNVIPVGSTDSGRHVITVDPVLGTDIDVVSSFSSRGPTLDGRIFPLVVAPGGWVAGARPPTATCPVPPDGAGLYVICNGTSFAAPHVAGALALIHQWWERETGEVPSPAMAKALLVNGATDIGDRTIPNHDEGWGRVNLGRVLTGVPDLWVDQGVVFTEPGDENSYEVEVEGAEAFRATLTWSDAPAAVGANPTLVNDLDLVVELLDKAGGTVVAWLGNVFEQGQSVGGGEADRLHNVENVFLAAPAPGVYRITVRASNVPGDGVPGSGHDTDQDFALVVRGGSAR